MQKIEGKQIYLRPITMEDTDRIVSWRNQDRVRHNFIYQKLFTKESHENWVLVRPFGPSQKNSANGKRDFFTI